MNELMHGRKISTPFQFYFLHFNSKKVYMDSYMKSHCEWKSKSPLCHCRHISCLCWNNFLLKRRIIFSWLWNFRDLKLHWNYILNAIIVIVCGKIDFTIERLYTLIVHNFLWENLRNVKSLMKSFHRKLGGRSTFCAQTPL